MKRTLIHCSRQAFWFSRLIRWAFGGLFISVGIIYIQDGGLSAILFGSAIFITGFFRPRRCLNEN